MSQYSLMQLKQQSTPAEFSRHVREPGAIYWWEPGKFWVISSYDLAKEALLNDAFSCDRSPFFISRMPEMNLSLIQDFFKVVGRMMVMSDAPEHSSRRRICYHGFSNRTIEHLKPVIEQAIARCLQTVGSSGRFDFVKDLAEIIPSSTLAELFAIPAAEREDFYRWSNNMTQFFGGSTSYLDADGIKVNHSARQLYDYFAALIEQRRAQPGEDFLSTLLVHQHAFGLTDDEIISQAVMMLVAGQVSTTDQLCNNAFILLSEPGLWSRLETHRELLDSYLEECSRLDPAVTFIFRVSKKDTVLGGQFIPSGSVIFISTHACNRDPAHFERPDELVVQESRPPHLGYGYGSHFCLGAKLARLEMNLVFQALLERFPELSFDSESVPLRKHHSLSFSGFERMVLRA